MNSQSPDAEPPTPPNANPNGAQNRLQILKTCFKKHYVSILILLSLFVGFLFFLRLWPTFKWSIPTSIIIAVLLIFMCVVILILGRDSQGPDFFRAASSVVLSLSLLLLLLWLLVNLVWPARYNLYHTDNLFDRDLPGTLVVRYPDTILADAKPAAFSFAWQPSTSLTTPLTITLNSLSSALQADVSLPHTLFTYTVTPTVAAPLTSHLSIRNGRTVSGDILFHRLQEETMVLEASPFTPTQTKPLSETLTIHVETEWGYTMRTFVNNAVTDRSPLLLAVTGLLAVAGFMYQEHLKANQRDKDRQAEERRREQEQREREKERQYREQALEKERQEKEQALELEISNFRQRLRERNSSEVKQSWERLQTQAASVNLPVELRKKLDVVKGLWQIVQADPLPSLVEMGRDWPDECVAAYLLAYSEHKIGKLGGLIFVVQMLPRNEVSPDLLDALERVEQQERAVHSPSRDWPGDLFTSSLRLPYHENEDRQQSKSDKFAKLIAWERAEQDAYNLFRTDGFWPGHEIVSRLKTLDWPTIVCGVPGSGRTTFALDLARYSLPNSQLALYLAQEPSLEDIQTGFGQLLLAFIKDHPILLGKLRTHERKALISLLVVNLGQAFVVAELDAAYRNIEEARNLSERIDGQQKNEVGNRIALSYLEQFSQEITSGSWPANLPPAVWASLLWRSAESLGFSDQRPRLVLDAGRGSANWWNRAIAPYVWAWHRNGVNVVLMIPALELAQLQHTSQFEILTIDWDKLSLKDMILHRAEKLLPHRLTIADLFENEALNLLIEDSKDESGSYTPRRWIQLWNRTIQLASPNQERITEVLVQQVLKSE